MTIGEAAAKGGVSRDTIRRWIKSGRLPATGGGATPYVIAPEDLEQVTGAEANARRKEEPGESSEVLLERVRGLQALAQRLELELEDARRRMDAQQEEIRALLTTNARMAEMRALPPGRPGMLARIFGRKEK